MTRNTLGTLALLGITTGIAGLNAQTASADIMHLDDVIITFSLCVGNDCVNGENFGFDTVRLKENNLRIHFDDTSASASFPKNDWRIVINDSGNGGDSYFRIEDSTAGRGVFQIDAGAPANALRVDSAGDVGIGASNPVVELHVKDGDSPTLRLEQDGSSGFTAQTFDLVSNEANFFVRDVTNGSQLPFRIKPGADTDALFIAANNDIGVGTDSPSASMHIKRNTGAFLSMVELENNGPVALIMDNNDVSNPVEWRMGQIPGNTDLVLVTPDSAGDEFKLSTSGNLTITGSFISGSTTLSVPDYVFSDDYELRSLNDVRAFIQANSHLPEVPSASEIAANGLDMNKMQMVLLKKVEELTLYTLAQEDRIAELSEEVIRLSN